MPYGQEIATVLPVDDKSMQTFQWGFEQKQRREALEEEKAQREAQQKKQDDLNYQNYLDQNFDADKYATSDLAANQVIQERLGALHQNSTMGIKNGMTLPQIMAANRGGLNNLKVYGNQVKSFNADLDKEMVGMGKSQSVDMEKVRKRTLRKAFFNDDGSPKDVNDIQPMSVRDLMMGDPDAFVKRHDDGQINHGDLQQYIKDARGDQIKDETVRRTYTTKGGKTETKDVDVSVLKAPGQEIVWKKDEKTGEENPELQFISKTVIDPATKQPIKMLNDDSYNQYFASDGAKLALMAETKKRNEGKDIDFTSAEGIYKLKETALDLLNDTRFTGTQVRYKNKEDVKKTPGYVVINAGGSKEQKKEVADYNKAKDSSLYATMKMLADGKIEGDPDPDHPNRIRVNDYIPGGNLKSTRKETAGGGSGVQAFSDVYIETDDKGNRNLLVKWSDKDEAVMISPAKRKSWLKRQAAANGVSTEHFDQMYKELFPKEDTETQEIKYNAVARDTIKDFATNGDPTPLVAKFKNHFINLDLGDGEVAKVQFVDVRPKGDKYDVDYRTKGGNVETKKKLTRAQVQSIIEKRTDAE